MKAWLEHFSFYLSIRLEYIEILGILWQRKQIIINDNIKYTCTITKKKLDMYVLNHNFKTTKCRHLKFSLLNKYTVDDISIHF